MSVKDRDIWDSRTWPDTPVLPSAAMSVARLRELLHEVPADRIITLSEVESLIEAASDEGRVTVGEAFVLKAALDAHRELFTPEAYRALHAFLNGGG